MTKQIPPDELLKALKIIVLGQLMTEALEDLQGIKMYNKQEVKMRINQLLPALCKIAENDYNSVFGIDEKLTLNIMYEYDKLVEMIAKKNIPTTIEFSQMSEAYKYDRPTMEATAHRIIKKHS